MGDQPTHNIIRKKADGNGWDFIGAGWEKPDGKISLSIEPIKGGEKIKGLLVKKEPKKAHEASKLEDEKSQDFGNSPIPF